MWRNTRAALWLALTFLRADSSSSDPRSRGLPLGRSLRAYRQSFYPPSGQGVQDRPRVPGPRACPSCIPVQALRRSPEGTMTMHRRSGFRGPRRPVTVTRRGQIRGF